MKTVILLLVYSWLMGESIQDLAKSIHSGADTIESIEVKIQQGKFLELLTPLVAKEEILKTENGAVTLYSRGGTNFLKSSTFGPAIKLEILHDDKPIYAVFLYPDGAKTFTQMPNDKGIGVTTSIAANGETLVLFGIGPVVVDGFKVVGKEYRPISPQELFIIRLRMEVTRLGQ